MKRKSNFVILLVFLSFSRLSFAQQNSINTLSLDVFLKMVKQYHPVAKQAENIIESAEAKQLLAKGGFDPKIYYDFKGKVFDGKNYYALNDGGFYIPTWFGLEFKGGLEKNNGYSLNPENTTPTTGNVYSQISLPLLQGLIIDERRSTLKQARFFKELSEYDKIVAINELLLKAGKAFWDWHLAYTNLKVYESAVNLSQVRFEAVSKTSLLGDRPAIDTVEAGIQLQDRIINLQQARLEYKTKSLMLSNFLWLENETPIEINENTVPDKNVLQQDEFTVFFQRVKNIDSIINTHPSLKIYEFKIKQLQVEEKFKKDKLKPFLRLNYNPLFEPSNFNVNFQDSYKWGLSFGFPILLRKERGDLQLTKIKIANTIYENKLKRVELLNKTKAGINEYNNYQLQSNVYSKNVSNYEKLWLSEKKLFENGESSLFMINSREMSYINAQIKLNEIVNKNKKAAIETTYLFGVLNMLY